MESERLLHPIINQIEVDTQNGVMEEKNSRYDNQPYGKLPIVKENMFESHISLVDYWLYGTFRPLEDFKDFHKNSTSLLF
jgi:hypothetical protein